MERCWPWAKATRANYVERLCDCAYTLKGIPHAIHEEAHAQALQDVDVFHKCPCIRIFANQLIFSWRSYLQISRITQSFKYCPTRAPSSHRLAQTPFAPALIMRHSSCEAVQDHIPHECAPAVTQVPAVRIHGPPQACSPHFQFSWVHATDQLGLQSTRQ